MVRSSPTEGGPTGGVTNPPRLGPSQANRFEADAWEPDPAELLARNHAYDQRYSEGPKVLNNTAWPKAVHNPQLLDRHRTTYGFHTDIGKPWEPEPGDHLEESWRSARRSAAPEPNASPMKPRTSARASGSLRGASPRGAGTSPRATSPRQGAISPFGVSRSPSPPKKSDLALELGAHERLDSRRCSGQKALVPRCARDALGNISARTGAGDSTARTGAGDSTARSTRSGQSFVQAFKSPVRDQDAKLMRRAASQRMLGSDEVCLVPLSPAASGPAPGSPAASARTPGSPGRSGVGSPRCRPASPARSLSPTVGGSIARGTSPSAAHRLFSRCSDAFRHPVTGRALGGRSDSCTSLTLPDDQTFQSAEYDLSRPVVDRLCDPRFYPGSSRTRFFDEEGRSLSLTELREERSTSNNFYITGAQGDRDNSYLFRRDIIFGPGAHPSEYITASSPMVHSRDALEVHRGKVIVVFRNGDPYHYGDTFVLQSSIRSMAQLFRKLTELLRPPCPIIELFDVRMRRLSRVDEVQHGERYLACEGQGPTRKKSALMRFLNQPLPQESET